MRHSRDNTGKTLDRLLRRHANPSPERMQSAIDRVGERLGSQIEPEDAHKLNVDSRPGPRRWWRASIALAAAAGIVAAALVSWNHSAVNRNDAGGLVHAVIGKSYNTNNGIDTVLLLPDTSRVEMRSESELAIERSSDGMRIHLTTGSIIVNAVDQGAGHLYVQTKDVTVSVVGTVFLVRAEEAGSQVAVIQGEVRVQGAIERQLQPGQEVATNPAMPELPLVQAISWSRYVQAHLALLQQATTGGAPAPAAVAERPSFAVVSIKPNVRNGPRGGYQFFPGSPNGPSWGFACHGTDGVLRATFGTGPEITVPQGRCIGNGVPLGYLVNYAYGTPWRYGPAVPDWARYDSGVAQEWFQIEAEADNVSTATTDQLKLMIQTMLTDRFKVKVHRESQETAGYALVVAKNGTKIRTTSGEEEQPALVLINGQPGIKGRSSLNRLAEFLMWTFNGNFIDVPFVNKTGLTEAYDYEFPLSPAGVGQRGAGPGPGQGEAPPSPLSRAEMIIQRAADASSSMEDRLGLRLQSAKLPVDVIMIDQVERPTPN